MYIVSICPACKDDNLAQFLTCKDYTVSHETFRLVKCNSCGLIATSPRPEHSELSGYYLSDNYISHSNTANSITDVLYKVARKFTLRWKTRIIRKYTDFSSNSIADVGCGTGEFLNACKTEGWTISGVEPSEAARNRASILLQQTVNQSIEELNGRYDAITLWHVLEHVADISYYLTQLKKHLTENGTLFIAVPNHASSDAKTYQENWAGYDVPRHLWHFSQTSMQRLLNSHYLQIEKIVPMKLDSYYVSILSEKYRGKNSLSGLINGLISGLRSNVAAQRTKEYSSLIYIVRRINA